MNLSSEEKLWAVISHLSAFLSGTGLVMPSFVWAENRKKSKRSAFQSLQALGYQSLGYTLWALVALFVLTILTAITWPMLKQGENIKLFVDSHMLVTVVLYAVYLLIPLIGAVRCALGHDFRYPLLGHRLARMIGYDPATDADAPLDEADEERFAAAMAHFAIVYPLWGMLPSLIFLLLPGERSRYMKFHALQTIIFQAVSTIVTFGLGVLSFGVLLAAAIPFVSNPNTYQPTLENITPVFIFLLCLMVTLLIVPLYQIIGQWAGLRLLQGHDYHYPIIGRLVEHWLEKREQAIKQTKP
jgi:uncharacterized Tic20 family protein